MLDYVRVINFLLLLIVIILSYILDTIDLKDEKQR